MHARAYNVIMQQYAYFWSGNYKADDPAQRYSPQTSFPHESLWSGYETILAATRHLMNTSYLCTTGSIQDGLD